ncbi:MAG TPA: glycosyl hydrolase 108 family protein [Burkholderiales bacterium]|nr:glycosyl hydrolase 108 family protein [Burkholderiales bacterium]
MASFKKALPHILANEGRYVDDPDDRGGETYKGVARQFNPDWPGWKAIDRARKRRNFPANLERNVSLQRQVREFYKQHYWDKLQGDVLSDQSLADELFDTAVNLGVARAVTFLQRALNVLNRNAALYADLAEDGVFGQRSLAAITAYLKRDKVADLLKVLNILQGMHYIEFMTKSPDQEKYARGWLKRVKISIA